MRRVVWFLVVVVLLAGGAVAADVLVRGQTEDRIAQQTAETFDLAEQPEVTIPGMTFLPQLAGGTIAVVELRAAEATVGDVPLRDVVVELRDVDVAEPHTTREVTFRGLVPLEALTAELELSEGFVVVRSEVLGMPLTVRATPEADGRAVVVRLDSVEVGGIVVPASELPAGLVDVLENFRVEVDALPERMVLDDVTVVEGGFLITASGTDVALVP